MDNNMSLNGMSTRGSYKNEDYECIRTHAEENPSKTLDYIRHFAFFLIKKIL